MTEDEDGGPILWLALAALQLESGEVEADVRANALTAIELNIGRWHEEASPEEAQARDTVVMNLRARLSP